MIIEPSRPRRAVFTICSNNYVPYAAVLLDSVRQHHPEADLFICLADNRHPAIPYPGVCTVVEAAELGIRDFRSFAFRYDVMELNTAVKPFMFTRLLRDLGYSAVLYFDPDIELFSPLTEVWERLEGGASFVLTPHLLSPAEAPLEPSDLTIMRAGVYNLGFLGASGYPEAMSVIAWWSRRLRYECVNDQRIGVFVDQKFVDLVPGFAPAAIILHDPGLNVAYWNLGQRHFEPEASGGPHVDGKPLGFFHYSGLDPRRPDRLSKHTEMFCGIAPGSSLATFLERYSRRLLAAGHGTIPGGIYPYSRFASGTPIPEEVRRMFRSTQEAWAGDPFETFEDWLHLPAPGSAPGRGVSYVTNLMAWARSRFPWLEATFDPTTPKGVEGFTHWWVHDAETVGFDPRYVQPVAERLGRRPPGVNALRPSPDPARADATVVGYLRTESGVGEIGRLTLRSLAAAGLQAEGLDVSLNVVSRREERAGASLLTNCGTGRLQVFCINADQLPCVAEAMSSNLRHDAYRVCVPFWELARFPDALVPVFGLVDEVWAPTRFIQAALVRVLDKPVVRMPVALEFPDVSPLPRTRFRLPDDRFLFLFAFDFLSFAERKNPMGVVRAFHRAFGNRPASSRPALVIKSHNSAHAQGALADLQAGLAEDPDVFLVDATVSRIDMLGLVAAADSVVSLHRGEGLGLLVAEAMALGTPVVATDYGATTELICPSTGFPVNFRLIPVRAGEYPFHEGQLWADADVDHAAWQMREVVDKPGDAARRATAARVRLRDEYSVSRVVDLQTARLREIGLL